MRHRLLRCVRQSIMRWRTSKEEGATRRRLLNTHNRNTPPLALITKSADMQLPVRRQHEIFVSLIQ